MKLTRGTPIAEALPLAETIGILLYGPRYVENVRLGGSLRRFCETIDRVDIVVASREPAKVRKRFHHRPEIQEIRGELESKMSTLAGEGLRVDLRVVEPERFGAASLHFTGSEAHYTKLRTRAQERGWLLNEHGLIESDRGTVIASETEEGIYQALGLEFIPAPMREDHGEIELALAGRLPRSVDHEDVRGDFHAHTPLPDTTRGTVSDLVSVAAADGYAYLALVDSSGGDVSKEKLGHQKGEIAALRQSFPNMTLLHGTRLGIAVDGSLEGDPAYYRELDWRVASVQTDFDLDAAKQTKRITMAMENPWVDAIARLSGHRLGDRPGMDLDFGTVFRKAAETGTAIELTALLDGRNPPSDALIRARDVEVTLVLGTEARTPPELDRMRWCVRQAQRGWVNPERIANCWPHEKFLAWLRKRR